MQHSKMNISCLVVFILVSHLVDMMALRYCRHIVMMHVNVSGCAHNKGQRLFTFLSMLLPVTSSDLPSINKAVGTDGMFISWVFNPITRHLVIPHSLGSITFPWLVLSQRDMKESGLYVTLWYSNEISFLKIHDNMPVNCSFEFS